MAAKIPKSYYLIGFAEEDIKNLRRPPTLRQLLQSFVFHHLEMRKPRKEAASSVIKSAMIIWNELGIKTKTVYKCESKLIKEYDEWHHLSRYHNIQKEHLKDRITKFTDRLDMIYDVKLSETITKVTQSSSDEEMDTSEPPLDVEMHQEEILGASG